MNDQAARRVIPDRVLLVDTNSEQQAFLTLSLPDRFHAVATTMDNLRDGSVEGQVVVFGPSFQGADALGQIRELSLADRRIDGILVVDEVSVDLMGLAFECGLREVIATGDVATELAPSINRLISRTQGAESDEHVEGVRRGEVVAVTAAKGGTGVTTAAVNIAVELAARGQRVALIDADLQFGDVALALGLRPRATIADAVATGSDLTPYRLDVMLRSHGDTGVRVLAAPDDPSEADVISTEGLVRVVEMARFCAAVVIVDAPSGLTGASLAILDSADRIVLVTVPAVGILHDTGVEIELLNKLGLGAKTSLLLNRVGPERHASKRRVEHRFPLPVIGMVPESRDIVVAESRTTPVIVDAHRSKAATAYRSIADHLTSGSDAVGPEDSGSEQAGALAGA